MARGEPVRRRQAGVLVVGAAEPEIQSWLRAAGHLPRAVRRVSAAGAALEAEPVDLVIVDRDSSGKDAPEVCSALREDPRLGDAWMLAITVAAKGRMADSVLNAGADDYLHRPFTRAELIARTRAGLRAAQERSNDRMLRTLMENVPGAIYRSAWHADHQLEMITDEIERISGYPPHNFLASTKRTILTLIHPEDLTAVIDAISHSTPEEPFELEYRIVRADGEVRWVLDRGQLVAGPGNRLWLDGAMFDITERKGAEEAALRHEVEAARTAELRASRARIIDAADKARRKIERDLHDGAQQRMVSLVLDVQVAKRRFAKDPTDIVPFFEKLGKDLQEASAELRELARGIHPAVLTERGLTAAVGAVAARCVVPVEVVDELEARVPPAVEATAYFTVAEALTNVAKYAEATHAVVTLTHTAEGLVVEVRDDGIGGASTGGGSGLSGLADRVGALDGTLSVDSPVGVGTLVRAVLPVNGVG
ncbi:PAS domain-containing protein [Solirubrobacter phytolaccae]|uniref:histidine kinase n=1 Tax=Solirubrobacter phytolaccae TaxID=1404360 RepID=A0A9X3SF90_9ACTN|nr:PAS domain-containing protein [Solirubrobacter phytolaccae]MDA0181157.1 PAS domain-containing protein [Solirubrobacter phytolaccae]